MDGDTSQVRAMNGHLTQKGFDVSSAAGGEEAVRMIRVFDPTLVVIDAGLRGSEGLTALEHLKHLKPEAIFMVTSANHTPELIFRASKLGADAFLPRPLDFSALDRQISALLEGQRSAALPAHLRDPFRDPERHPAEISMLFGTSPRMVDVKNTIEQVAETNATVLVRGESGTGKEVVARLIVAHSLRRDKPFVKVNCAAIPNELLESELFGYEPGAFTGANRQKLGKFDLAHGGTIFLDEISEMHPSLQAKLLHVLQDGEFSRLGGKRDIAVDVRVLAATNRQLEHAVEEGTFRRDLFYRLNVITVNIPPLRERREEIPVFLNYFLQKYSEYYGKQPVAYSDAILVRMMEYNWPGNIRELENMVKRYVIVGNQAQILRELTNTMPAESIPYVIPTGRETPASATPGMAASAPEEQRSLLEIGRHAAQQAERQAITRVLNQTRWNRRQAAQILKVSYKAFLNKLRAMEEETHASQPSESDKP